uniref:Rho GDP-dissociation inhibitor 1 n=1 Tax=Seriola lalandi dorsalis TaxID=1841481 RepID=A0A3B4WLS8_SERLL
DDESLRKYKEALLGSTAVVADPTAPNVQVTRMTLVCEAAPQPLVLDLQGDLEGFRKNPFVLKEGVEYRIKINFKVRESGLCLCLFSQTLYLSWETAQQDDACCFLQVNKEIVSGLKYIQQSFRKGVKGKTAKIISFNLCNSLGRFYM